MVRRRLDRFKFVMPTEEALAKYLREYPPPLMHSALDTLPQITSHDLFSNDRPLIADLGCGRGEFTILLAQTNPTKNYIGIDNHKKALYDAVYKANQQNIDNILFLWADLKQIMAKIPNEVFEEVYLMFPPPHKPKYLKKEFLTLDFICDLHRTLKLGRHLHFVTDVADFFYAKHDLILKSTGFSVVSTNSGIEGGKTWYQRIWESHGLRSYRAEYVRT